MPQHKRHAFYSDDGHIDIDIGPHSDGNNNHMSPPADRNNNNTSGATSTETKTKTESPADEEACHDNLGSTAALTLSWARGFPSHHSLTQETMLTKINPKIMKIISSFNDNMTYKFMISYFT